MAFDDAKKYADKLRIKNIGLFDMGDPNARRERCWSPWCGVFVENMRDNNRCNRPECDRRLWVEAVKQGYAIRDPKSGTYMGDISGLLRKPTFDVPIEYMPFEVHADPMMCRACKREVKRPNSEVCITCHIAGKSEQFNKKRSKNKGHKSITNRIKGLERFRGKVNK